MTDLHAALAELASLDRPALGQRWEAAFETRAPLGSQSTLLRQALAWHVQMQALGKGAAKKTRKTVEALNKTAAGEVTLSPGTRLLRNWQGRTHNVTVVAEGFEYDGKLWRSLSAIAKSITGTSWSGPAFFGVKP